MNFDRIRKIVSGKKSRLEDTELGLDLDLSYITDNIIIMGYPASGLESLYRNRRKDVRKWLEARHGKNYRIYNFCPRRENEYDSSYFHDQVRRFPFPDHHAPPLSIIPLFVHDITGFLNASTDNVAVIHCKAGKGRSGTMTVCYLLTLAQLPQPPRFKDLYIKSIQQLDPSNSATTTTAPQLPPLSIQDLSLEQDSPSDPSDSCLSDRLNRNSQALSQQSETTVIQGDTSTDDTPRKPSGNPTSSSEAPQSTPSPIKNQRPGKGTPPHGELVTQIIDDLLTPRTANQPKHLDHGHHPISDVKLMTDMAEKIMSLFQYHTTRRMADPTSVPYGISIPSQRRSIRYWGDVLLGKDPRQFINPNIGSKEEKKRVEIKWIKVYVPESFRYAKVINSKAKVAVQLARYKDSYSKDLKQREKKLSESGHYPIVQPSLEEKPQTRADFKTSTNQQQQREERYDDQMWEDREEMINAFASFGQEKPHQSVIRKAKSMTVDNKSLKSEEGFNSLTRRSTEFDRPPGSRASMATDFTSTTNSSMLNIDETQLSEEEHFDTFDSQQEEEELSFRYLTPVRLYDFPSSTSDQGLRKIKGGKNIKSLAGGVIVDVGREILLRIVIGSTGKNHASLLPDATLLGYLWFIPAFHEPNFGTFSNTSKVVHTQVDQNNSSIESSTSPLIVTSFPKEEIDFLNANITKVEVAWTRV